MLDCKLMPNGEEEEEEKDEEEENEDENEEMEEEAEEEEDDGEKEWVVALSFACDMALFTCNMTLPFYCVLNFFLKFFLTVYMSPL